MEKKWLLFNAVVLIVLVLFSIFLVWNFSFKEVAPSEQCLDVNNAASFVYDICYDAYSKSIFLNVQRSYDSYNIQNLKVSFFDFSNQFYKLRQVPGLNGSKVYKIPAEKNPKRIYVSYDINKDFSAPICNNTRSVSVGYCPSVQKNGINASITSIAGISSNNFIEIGTSTRNSDNLDLSLVDKERVWETKCDSIWECGEWGECIDGVQKRECRDSNNCFASTEKPRSVRYCNDDCVENWECSWSPCENGFTSPNCKDLNSCGTSYNIPKKLKCDKSSECLPDVECGEWSSCKVNYSFLDLSSKFVGNINGTRSRLCVDKNGCVNTKEEKGECSLSVDVYTKKSRECGQDFIEVYNSLNNKVLAKIKEGTGDNLYLNIYLDDYGEKGYCDYCFDGKKDGDEEDIDCGGSCKSCEEKQKVVDFEKDSWVESLGNWVGGLFD